MATNMIQHSRPTIEEDDLRVVEESLRSGMVASGAKVREFEDALSGYIGGLKVRGASSGKSALVLALLSGGIGSGDEVILPTYVCRSVMDAIIFVGAKPVVVDISDDYCIAVDEVRRHLTSRTKAIIAVHIFGISCRIREIIETAKPAGVMVIEDCAQSIGGELGSHRLGSFGDMSFFSFHATKVMTSGEGGMLLLNREDLAARFRKDVEWRAGFFGMSDLQASLGLSQFRKLPRFLEKRRVLADSYIRSLSGSDDVTIPRASAERSIFFRFPVRVERPFDFDRLRRTMEDTGIHVRKGVDAMLHTSTPDPPACPEAVRLFGKTISLPIYPSLNVGDCRMIALKLREVLKDG